MLLLSWFVSSGLVVLNDSIHQSLSHSSSTSSHYLFYLCCFLKKEYEPVISRPFAMAQPEQVHWTSSYVDAPQVVGNRSPTCRYFMSVYIVCLNKRQANFSILIFNFVKYIPFYIDCHLSGAIGVHCMKEHYFTYIRILHV